MAVTKTMQVVRKFAGKDATIFNDKLAGGVRSIKVWGWNSVHYDRATRELEAAGLGVTKVEFTKYSTRGGCNYKQTRLHVVE